jgi:hypothetical protein
MWAAPFDERTGLSFARVRVSSNKTVAKKNYIKFTTAVSIPETRLCQMDITGKHAIINCDKARTFVEVG